MRQTDGLTPGERLFKDLALLELHLASLDEGGGEQRASVALADETKAVPALAEGLVDGYLSAWQEDLTHDVIAPGAFKTALAEAQAHRRTTGGVALWPLLWQHMREEPIGYISDAWEDGKGLRCLFQIDTSFERGRQAFNGLKSGALAFSIGFKPVKYHWLGSVRHLTEIALGEGSVVTFPANPEARPILR